jgi:putative ABC transport system permease protein
MKFALRSLLKSPGYTVIALITLALGIGVNTSMFTLVDALLFRTAPFPRPDEIHQVTAFNSRGRFGPYSEIETREVRERATSYSSLTTIGGSQSALAEPGRPAERVNGTTVSADFFATFGVQPLQGRPFAAEEYQSGKNQVILLSAAFWQNRFGGDREIIGRTLRLDGESVTVIGVMPPSFDYRFLWGTTAFWRPINFTPEQLKSRTYRIFNLIGRLKPGVTAGQATAELSSLAASQQKDFPQDYSGLRYQVVVLHEALMDDESRKIIWMLLGLSGFVLLIACANLANLQLARATTAVREFAIRAALGASRARLIGQQLTECLVLSLTGGGLGILLALWINNWLTASIRIAGESGGLPLTLNPTILLVTLAAALLTGILFGIVPAWFASRADVVSSLKSQSRGSTSGRGQHRMRQALIVAEVALALVLLGGAGVMRRGFDRFLHKEVGWDTSRVLTGILPIGDTRFTDPQKLEFYRKVETRLAALPGVESAAISTSLPIWNYGSNRQVATEQQSGADKAGLPIASHVMVTADFFTTLGIKLVEGRLFERRGDSTDPKQVVINDNLARQLWPGKSAVGQRLGSLREGGFNWEEVVGVVRTVDGAANLGNPDTLYHVYHPIVHEPWSWVRFSVRSANPAALIDSVRRAIGEVEPDLPADQLETVAQTVDRSQHNLVIVGDLLGGFAFLGLVLASVGLYGVISNLVAQRTSEFGIRLALGASPGDVLRLVLRTGLVLTMIGLLLGLGGAYGLNRFLGSIFPRLVGNDPVALLGMAAALLTVALLACWIPARRATKVDPLEALRAE